MALYDVQTKSLACLKFMVVLMLVITIAHFISKFGFKVIEDVTVSIYNLAFIRTFILISKYSHLSIAETSNLRETFGWHIFSKLFMFIWSSTFNN